MYACSGCGGGINGSYTSYNNRIFHPQCFTCSSCDSPLGNSRFYIVNGLPSCSDCNANNSGPKCRNCKQSFKPGISYKILGDGCYHNECFKCAGPCQSPISGSYYTLKNQYVCTNCYNSYGNDFDKHVKKEEPKKEEPKKEEPKKEEPKKIQRPIYY